MELSLAIASKGYQGILTSHDPVITHIKFFFSFFFSLSPSLSLSFFHGQIISIIGRMYLPPEGSEDYLRCCKRSSLSSHG